MTSEDKELITLDATKTTLLSSSPEFEAWVASLDPKHWAKYDLGACRLGWEAGRAAFAAKPAKVGVKPLEWVHRPVFGVWSAASDTYWVWERNGIGYWRRWWPDNAGDVVAEGGQESAKAAAQADYEARILSALVYHEEPVSGDTPAPQRGSQP